MLRLFLLCSALAFATAGCYNARHADRAGGLVDVPGAFSDADGRDAVTVCNDPNIPLLNALVTQLNARNFQLAREAARIREARAAADAEFAARWPAFSASLSATRSNSVTGGSFDLPPELLGGQGGDATQTRYRATVASQWELDLWGRLSASARAAALSFDAARAQREALLVSLSAELADALSMRLGQHAATELLYEQVDASERYLELTRLRYGQGQAAGADILRQRQQLEGVRSELALALAREAATSARLSVLLGSAENELPDVLPALSPPAPIPEAGLPADVISRRPDIAAAYLQLAAADEAAAAAFARRLPGVTLTGSIFDVRNDFSQLFGDLLWQFAGEIATTVFDAGRLAAAARQAESRAEQALYEYAQAVVEAIGEVQSALADNTARDENLESLLRQVNAARQALQIERRLYVAGQRDFLSVLTALQTLQQGERQLIEARIAQVGARIELCRALGYAVGIDTADAGRA